MTPLSFPLFPGLSARDALSLSTDGPIAASQWAAASAHDLAHPLTPGPARIRIASVVIKRRCGVTLLRRAMAQAIAARGSVEERDLASLGLTKRQVAEWSGEALAQVLARHPGFTEFAFTGGA